MEPTPCSKLILQIVSDLHFDVNCRGDRFRKDIKVPDNGKDVILVVLGDLSNNPFSPQYEAFLRWSTPRYKKVLIITGNHEYYCGQSIDFVDTRIRDLCDQYGAKFLQRETETIDGVTFLGTTLWSHIPNIEIEPPGKPSYSLHKHVRETINDYKLIENFTVVKSNELFSLNKAWLTKTIKTIEGPCVVFTHHGPQFYEIPPPAYVGSSLNYAYGTDMSDLFNLQKKDPAISLWAYGHSHYPRKDLVGKTMIVCNARGYMGECQGRYNPQFLLEYDFEEKKWNDISTNRIIISDLRITRHYGSDRLNFAKELH